MLNPLKENKWGSREEDLIQHREAFGRKLGKLSRSGRMGRVSQGERSIRKGLESCERLRTLGDGDGDGEVSGLVTEDVMCRMGSSNFVWGWLSPELGLKPEGRECV